RICRGAAFRVVANGVGSRLFGAGWPRIRLRIARQRRRPGVARPAAPALPELQRTGQCGAAGDRHADAANRRQQYPGRAAGAAPRRLRAGRDAAPKKLMRSGTEYREALRDGRKVWAMGGGAVDDVTTHPATRTMVEEYVAWYDRHLDAEWQDILLAPAVGLHAAAQQGRPDRH